jgi:Ni/Co efflux regulator RcnB
MKRLLLATALAALVLSSPVFAGDHGHGHGHGHGYDHDDDRDHDRDRDDYRRWDDDDHHDNGRHEGWYKPYHRGDRIDVVYLQPRYYVPDYRVYHLAPPPPGHRYIRYPDGRVLLVAIASGVIADIILNH